MKQKVEIEEGTRELNKMGCILTIETELDGPQSSQTTDVIPTK